MAKKQRTKRPNADAKSAYLSNAVHERLVDYCKREGRVMRVTLDRIVCEALDRMAGQSNQEAA